MKKGLLGNAVNYMITERDLFAAYKRTNVLGIFRFFSFNIFLSHQSHRNVWISFVIMSKRAVMICVATCAFEI